MLTHCLNCGENRTGIFWDSCPECGWVVYWKQGGDENDYEFRAYCDICRDGSDWVDTDPAAREWRESHFDSTHPDNPMKKANCRIQRRAVDESD